MEGKSRGGNIKDVEGKSKRGNNIRNITGKSKEAVLTFWRGTFDIILYY